MLYYTKITLAVCETSSKSATIAVYSLLVHFVGFGSEVAPSRVLRYLNMLSLSPSLAASTLSS